MLQRLALAFRVRPADLLADVGKVPATVVAAAHRRLARGPRAETAVDRVGGAVVSGTGPTPNPGARFVIILYGPPAARIVETC